MPPHLTDAATLFRERQAEAQRDVEARLAHWLGDAAGKDTPKRLAAAMRYATLGAGKRFRAFLVLESARLFNAPRDAALDVAAALECVHAYSLVHDDLPAMDNDSLRRGQPTVWKHYDEWTAILAGDALLTLAFEIIAGIADVPPATRLVLIAKLALASGRAGMVGGQALDLAADKRGEPAHPTVAHIEQLQAMKTGALIGFACEAGALLGQASVAEGGKIAIYGGQLGQAFQLSDDLLDAEGDAVLVGKAVGKDAAQGKATLVGQQGVTSARTRLDAIVALAIDALAPFGARAAALAGAARFMASRKS